MRTIRTIHSLLRRFAFLSALLVASPWAAYADDLTEGIAAYKRKNFRQALTLLEPLARGGSSQAQLRLGQMYYYGQGVPENDAAAFDWFSRAAAQGNAEAQAQLAGMYLYGLGPAKDAPDPDLRAAQWYFAAARQGHPEAQYSLGLLFAVGKGVQRSDKEARKWMQRAAAQGSAEARSFLATYPKDR